MLDLDVLQATAENATPGEWEAGQAVFEYDFLPTPLVAPVIGARNICQVYSEKGMADAEFIAAFNPEVVLALIAELRQAREAIAKWRKGSPVGDISLSTYEGNQS